jgi:hypothetical protein
LSLPRELLGLQVYTHDGLESLEYLISEETKEQLTGFTYKTDVFNEVVSFQGWTENDFLILTPTQEGFYLARFDRNPPVGE